MSAANRFKVYHEGMGGVSFQGHNTHQNAFDKNINSMALVCE
jgi:hypothetical protein